MELGVPGKGETIGWRPPHRQQCKRRERDTKMAEQERRWSTLTRYHLLCVIWFHVAVVFSDPLRVTLDFGALGVVRVDIVLYDDDLLGNRKEVTRGK